MQPITRATVDNYCRVCLQDLDKQRQPSKDTKVLQFSLKDDPQLFRIIEAMAKDKNMPSENISMPSSLCHSCYTKVSVFKKFAEMSISSIYALRELMAEKHKLTKTVKFRMICGTCFKIKSGNNAFDHQINRAEMKDLLRIITMGLNELDDLEPRNTCKHCSQKFRTFIEFKKLTQESQQYCVSVLANTDEFVEDKPDNTQIVENSNQEYESNNLNLKSLPIINQSSDKKPEIQTIPRSIMDKVLCEDSIEVQQEIAYEYEKEANPAKLNSLMELDTDEDDSDGESDISDERDERENNINYSAGSSEYNVFGNDSEPEIDNVIPGTCNNNNDPFENLCPSSEINVKTTIEGSKKKLFIRCDKCNRTFRKMLSYESHKCDDIGKDTKLPKKMDPVICDICHKDFKSGSQLRAHIDRVHCKAEHMCPYCQREFKRKCHLKDHVRLVHEGLRPYKCEYCDRAFGLPRTLRVHLMGHTNERPFKCNNCAKSFRQQTELNIHIKAHNPNPQVRCPICSQLKSSKEELETHLSRHKNKEGYQCSKCGRKFKKQCHLKEHDDAVHLKLRPFECAHINCGKSFAARKTLQIHQKKHMPKPTFECDICSKVFYSRATLLKHFSTHIETVINKNDT